MASPRLISEPVRERHHVVAPQLAPETLGGGEHRLPVGVPVPQADLTPRTAVGPDPAILRGRQVLERAPRLRAGGVAGHEAPAATEVTRSHADVTAVGLVQSVVPEDVVEVRDPFGHRADRGEVAVLELRLDSPEPRRRIDVSAV